MSEQEQTGNRWVGRPWLAQTVRASVYIVPFVFSVAAAFAMSLAIPPAPNVALAVLRVFAITAGATVAMRVVDSLTRRMLPVAALLDLTLVFPDQAPSRFKVALRGGASNVDLQQKLDAYQKMGANEPAAAAERLLELVGALSKHDRLTRGHSERVRAYAQMIGKEMGLSGDDLDKLRWAGLIHDIGKLKIDPAILNKPGKLTNDEYEIIKTHPDLGAELAAPLAGWLGESVLAVSQHHEKWDGTGYPRGLRTTEISLAARIVAVADVFDVMTSVRSYKAARPASEARAELARCAGSHFDPAVVRAFLNLSLGRLRLAMGPVSWFTQLSLFPQQLLASASAGGSSVATAAASTASATATASAGAAAGALTVAAAATGAAAGGPLMSHQYDTYRAPEVPAAIAPATTLPAELSDPVVVTTTIVLGSASLGVGSGGVAAVAVTTPGVTIPPPPNVGGAPTGDGTPTTVSAVAPPAAAQESDSGDQGAAVPTTAAATPTTTKRSTTTTEPRKSTTTTAAPRSTTTTAPRSTTTAAPRSTTTTAPRSTTTTAPRSTTTTAPRSTTTTAPKATPTTTKKNGNGNGNAVVVTTLPPVAAAPTVAPTAAPAVAPTAAPTTAPPTTEAPAATVAPPTTTTAPLPAMTGTWQLGSSAAGDVAAQAVLPLAQRDPLNATVVNLDTDRDQLPGRTVTRGGWPFPGNPAKMPRFSYDAGTAFTVSGKIQVDLMVAPVSGEDQKLKVKALIVKCDDSGTLCVPLRDTSSSIKGDAGTFQKMTFDFGTRSYQFAIGERFEVWILVNSDSDTDAVIAYDSVDAPSVLRIG